MITPSSESQNIGANGRRTPDEIVAEIEGTRERLARTLDALEDKLSARRRLHAAADSARHMGENLMRSASDTLSPDITTMIRLDHAHVLALFRRFKPFTSPSRKKALVANACLALQIHAQLEEEIFYPALREAVGPSETLDKSVPEHDEMRSLITTLQSMEPRDVGYDETFRKLMRAVLHHVADEETTLLPQAEELMSHRLAGLGKQMTKRRVELLKPHAAEVAVTTMRSFPVAFATAVAGVTALSWLAFRPRKHM
jgi:hemerythrin superfamily protein